VIIAKCSLSFPIVQLPSAVTMKSNFPENQVNAHNSNYFLEDDKMQVRYHDPVLTIKDPRKFIYDDLLSAYSPNEHFRPDREPTLYCMIYTNFNYDACRPFSSNARYKTKKR